MTEEEARAWLRETLGVSRETEERLERFAAMVCAANESQNLISAATVPHIWARHIVDSAQLYGLAGARANGRWIDLGSGPGFPGVVLAILGGAEVHLVEERKARVAFLNAVVGALGLPHVTVHGAKAERIPRVVVDVITARAFAPLEKLFSLAHKFSTQKTLWLLPKGQSAQSELESVCGTWQGAFHVKHSITHPEAAIIVAEGVRKAGKA